MYEINTVIAANLIGARDRDQGREKRRQSSQGMADTVETRTTNLSAITTDE